MLDPIVGSGHDGNVRFRFRVIIGDKGTLDANSRVLAELFGDFFDEYLDGSIVPRAMGGHPDDQSLEQLDTLAFENPELDQPIVFRSAKRPNVGRIEVSNGHSWQPTIFAVLMLRGRDGLLELESTDQPPAGYATNGVTAVMKEV